MIRLAFLLIVIGILLLVLTPRASDTFTALVIGVQDGDSITVLRDTQQIRIRLSDIDAPEHGQPFGEQAKLFTSRLVFRQTVTITPRGTDKYGRLVARVVVRDTDVNLALVQAGLAWWYARYSHDSSVAQAESLARLQRVGIWSEPHPVPPWLFRRK